LQPINPRLKRMASSEKERKMRRKAGGLSSSSDDQRTSSEGQDFLIGDGGSKKFSPGGPLRLELREKSRGRVSCFPLRQTGTGSAPPRADSNAGRDVRSHGCASCGAFVKKAAAFPSWGAKSPHPPGNRLQPEQQTGAVLYRKTQIGTLVVDESSPRDGA